MFDSILSDPLWILTVLCAMVVTSEALARWGPMRHLGSALLVIVLTSVVANLGVIPTVTEGSPVYDIVFSTVAPLAIFWLLLGVDLRSVLRAGPVMLGLFLLGSVGTFVGVLAGMAAAGGGEVFGPLHHALGGMFVGTYTGGSINFNAVALEYGVMKDGVLYAGAAVVDSLMTTIWMIATVALPRILRRLRPASDEDAGVLHDAEADGVSDYETVGVIELGLLAGMGAGALWLSNLGATWTREALGWSVPSILILTTLALALAQIPAVQRIRGGQVIGWFAVVIFLAVIGALCDIAALVRLGDLAPALMVFVVTIVAIHGLLVFGAALLFRLDLDAAAVASQANIGGGTSALALARSLERSDLALPAILVGALGNALGTYLGFLAAAMLA
ncbi:MAG: DUF819 family protein [Thermoanaerobaculia bacterium]|nr:DUF819 family protein [Thermoanaerobaculia bacterium]